MSYLPLLIKEKLFRFSQVQRFATICNGPGNWLLYFQ
jgi:hypothetical protein